MIASMKYSAVLLSAISAIVNASPMPADPPPEICGGNVAHSSGTDAIQFNVASTKTNQPGAPVTGEFSCSGGCTFETGSEYSVSVDVSIGISAELDFEKIVEAAGISADVSISTESTTSQGVQKPCPAGPWTCALIITPPVTIVTGTRTALGAGCRPGTPEPYTVSFPERQNNGVQMGAQVDICACRNFAHWADNGAPSIVCPQDCVQ